MGPPPFGDGNREWRSGYRRRRGSFNGATAFRRWKPHGSPRTPPRCRTFNGATAFRRWKPLTVSSSWMCVTILQWGHRLSAMETCLCVHPTPMCRPAFNGATAFRRWKPGVLDSIPTQYEHLQWGHRLSAMETIWINGVSYAGVSLQWGHRLSAMETLRLQSRGGQRQRPSMGPPPFGDGNLRVPDKLINGCAAFNGATAFRRWKRGVVRRCCRQALAFNGATAFRRWKLVCHAHC